jgi:hypothetical protein
MTVVVSQGASPARSEAGGGMTSTPLSGDVQEVVIGALLGIVVSLGAQYLLTWRNLRWTGPFCRQRSGRW